ncbi:MAG: proline iminopeptidase, partial [Muriicola sp.]|nr:proline iminopeptidase [Muriicola sp.]
MKFYTLLFSAVLLFISCQNNTQNSDKQKSTSAEQYLSFENRDDQFTGGIKMIPVTTEKGTFNVWTKRIGTNPTKKVLLLHGGPGMTHELYECFDGYFPQEEIEYIYYDQLGSYYSEQP